MLLFIKKNILYLIKLFCFNTSHVVIYLNKWYASEGYEYTFQYISCCYLSTTKTMLLIPLVGFNTSHVVIYPYLPVVKNSGDASFNTSHVVIYPAFLATPFHVTLVSIHLMLLFIMSYRHYRIPVQSFNTSHVVIYHNLQLKALITTRFQYISCCYLSKCFPVKPLRQYCFNTSHVVIYRICYSVDSSI